MLRPFRSIESKYGVEEPGYQPPAEPPLDDAAIGENDPEADHRASGLELFVAFIFPLGGFGLAVWRFARGDIGPGIANLMLAVLSAAIAVSAVLALR